MEMTHGDKKDGAGDGAKGSEAAVVRQEMMNMKFQMEAQMGAIQGNMNGLHREMGEIKELLCSLVKPSTGDTDQREIDEEAQQEAEVEEVRRRVRALADLDLNSGVMSTQTQQGDINASNSPMGYLVGQNSEELRKYITLNLLGGLVGRREMRELVYKSVNQEEKSNDFLKSIAQGPRQEFSVFDGENPLEWIRWCDKYFELAKVPEENICDLVTSYMTGRVDNWLRGFGLLINPIPWSMMKLRLCVL